VSCNALDSLSFLCPWPDLDRTYFDGRLQTYQGFGKEKRVAGQAKHLLNTKTTQEEKLANDHFFVISHCFEMVFSI
jgi:hypothetical protein